MELLERFDNKRVFLNKVVERYKETPGEYEQVVHLWIMNEEGKFLMQQRSLKKRIYPGKWSVTGGAVDPGEKPIDAVYRECKEEIGANLDPNKVEFMMSLKRSHVFIDIFLDKENINENDLKLQEDEVACIKWLDRQEIKDIIKNNDTANSIVKYFDLLCELIDEQKNL